MFLVVSHRQTAVTGLVFHNSILSQMQLLRSTELSQVGNIQHIFAFGDRVVQGFPQRVEFQILRNFNLLDDSSSNVLAHLGGISNGESESTQYFNGKRLRSVKFSGSLNFSEDNMIIIREAMSLIFMNGDNSGFFVGDTTDNGTLTLFAIGIEASEFLSEVNKDVSRNSEVATHDKANSGSLRTTELIEFQHFGQVSFSKDDNVKVG
mmetsp:Transcript_26402/g.30278  ORF Transcript_26402/g.30278 Transcript_26402/m.30278 type:complete len:207 (+) Transcript_26402:975-1595(+)